MRKLVLCLFFSIGFLGNGLAGIPQQISTSASTQIPALKKACDECKRLGTEGKFDSLYKVIRKNLPVAIKLDDSLSIANLHFFLGYYYRGKGNFSKAIESIEESIIIFKRLNDLPDMARSMYMLNIIHADDGNKEEAIRMGMENLRFFKKTKQARQLASTYSLLSVLYNDLKNDELSSYFQNEYSKYKVTEAYKKEYDNLSKLVGFYQKQGKHKAELKYRKKILEAVRRSKMPTLQIEVLIGLANYFTEQNHDQKASLYLAEALQIAKKVQNSIQISIVYRQMAKVQHKSGDDEMALALLKEATTFAREDKSNNHIISALEELAYIEEKTGHYKQALKTTAELNMRKDSLLNKERLKFAADAGAKYDLEKKENNIALLNKENRLQLVLARANRIKMKAIDQKTYFLFSIVLILSFLVVAIAYFYYKSQILRAQLANQQDILKVQAKELEESNLLKDKMFSIISHDLRSPVGSLKASLTLLNTKNQNQVHLNQFEQQVDFLQYTLDNVLYWSLSQQKAISTLFQSVDLLEIMEEVADSLSGMVLIKDINLILHKTSATLLIDEQLLTIVLRNILHNAIKFTPKNGSIEMLVFSDGGSTQIQIKDTGPGIGADPGSNKKSRQHGTGLGLNLSRELMKRNSGELKISSLPNEGTTVTLSWEKQQEHVPDKMLADSYVQQ